MTTPQIVLYVLGGLFFLSGVISICTNDSKTAGMINLILGTASFLLAVYNPFVPVDPGRDDPPTNPPVVDTCNHKINSSDVEDYSDNLNPEEYLMYSSDNYKDFYFYYPLHLFNKVECSFDSYKTALGNNIESHTFLGSNGTEISFELSSRTDGSSTDEAFSTLYTQATAEIKSSKKDIWRINTDIAGFSVTGFDDNGRIIYRLIRIYDNNVMDLRIACPPYKNEEDRRQKRYVQDCIIKKCGFTNPKWKNNISMYSEFEKN